MHIEEDRPVSSALYISWDPRFGDCTFNDVGNAGSARRISVMAHKAIRRCERRRSSSLYRVRFRRTFRPSHDFSPRSCSGHASGVSSGRGPLGLKDPRPQRPQMIKCVWTARPIPKYGFGTTHASLPHCGQVIGSRPPSTGGSAGRLFVGNGLEGGDPDPNGAPSALP